eukprot:6195724-Pleurochrysis_carterae.AAC.3
MACGAISSFSTFDTLSSSKKAGGLTRISPAARNLRGVKILDSSKRRSTSAKYCGGKDVDDSGGSDC